MSICPVGGEPEASKMGVSMYDGGAGTGHIGPNKEKQGKTSKHTLARSGGYITSRCVCMCVCVCACVCGETIINRL